MGEESGIYALANKAEELFPVGLTHIDAERDMAFFKLSDIPGDLDKRFDEFLSHARSMGYEALLRGREPTLYVFRAKRRASTPSRDLLITAATFAATLVTIGYAGYLFSGGEPFSTATYIIAMSLIITLHEMGHYLASRRYGLNVSSPIFLPGLPSIGGTFGAIIRMREPPRNRVQEMVIGFSGPISGFIVALVVSYVGLLWSKVVPASQVSGGAFLPTPVIFDLLAYLTHPNIASDSVIVLHPVAFAGWVGMVITFLNLTPVGQLDGGHVLRGLTSEKVFNVLSWIFIIVLLLTRFYLMAIIAVFVKNNPGPLNDVSRPNKKYWAFSFAAMFIWFITGIWLF